MTKIAINKTKDIIIKGSLDVLNQYIMNGGDIKQIDWANVMASAFLKNSHLKNLVSSMFDVKYEMGEKDMVKWGEDLYEEFGIRTLADLLFNSYTGSSGLLKLDPSITKKWFEDLLKKNVRKAMKEVLNEVRGSETDSTPEN